jgi:CRP-like cAMP-binding protein
MQRDAVTQTSRFNVKNSSFNEKGMPMPKNITVEIQAPEKNYILAKLGHTEIDRLLKHLEPVNLKLGDVIYGPNQHISHAYFPTTSIISLQYIMDTGACAEAAEVGNEGMLGLPILLGGNATPNTAIVQTAGHAYRLDQHILKTEFNSAGIMQRLLLRYTQAMMTQMFQTAACNRHHTIEQQLCRWLLLTVDRIPSGELLMTQELVANMLGVRRESITEAAKSLQDAGCIRYRRGHISVLDRPKLERCVCECYSVVKEEFIRLMSSVS